MTEQAAEVVEQTVRFLLLAGERADTLNPSTAQRHYERVLDLVSPEDPRRGGRFAAVGVRALTLR